MERAMSGCRNRGFIQLSLMGYAAIAAGVVIVGLTIWGKLGWAKYDAAQQANAALAQQVSQWQAASKACSDGAAQVEEDARKRSKTALESLRKAQEEGKGSQAEAERLRAIVAGGTCQAATVEVRKGFK